MPLKYVGYDEVQLKYGHFAIPPLLSPLFPVRNSEPLPREGSSPPAKSQGETWPPLELFSAYITRGVGAPLMFYTTLCSP